MLLDTNPIVSYCQLFVVMVLLQATNNVIIETKLVVPEIVSLILATAVKDRLQFAQSFVEIVFVAEMKNVIVSSVAAQAVIIASLTIGIHVLETSVKNLAVS